MGNITVYDSETEEVVLSISEDGSGVIQGIIADGLSVLVDGYELKKETVHKQSLCTVKKN